MAKKNSRRGPRANLEVQGLRELRRTMREAGDELEDFKAANKEAAEIAAEGARRIVQTVTGELKATIRASGTKTAGVIRAGKKRVPYAGVLEWGWPRFLMTPAKRPRGGPIEPQSFLSTGARNTESTWIPVYTKRLNDIISKVEGK